MSPARKDLCAVSLFAGGGGLTKGVQLGGFNIVFVSDISEWCCETLRRNFPGAIVETSDVKYLSGTGILTLTGKRPGEISLVCAGPPCQAFTILGKRKSLDDPRGQLVFEFVRLVSEVQPEAFVFENVRGILSVNRGRDWQRLLQYFSSTTGYKLYSKVLNAVEFGVPQSRERVFVVGFRDRRLRFAFLSPTHGATDGLGLFHHGMLPYVTVRQVLQDVEGLPNHEKRIHGPRVLDRYKKILPGGRDKTDHTDRLEWHTPAGTVLVGSSAGGGRSHIHPSEHRHITAREAARLQSFPDSYVFCGSSTAQYRQIGNAVPPLLAKAVARAIRRALEGEVSKEEDELPAAYDYQMANAGSPLPRRVGFHILATRGRLRSMPSPLVLAISLRSCAQHEFLKGVRPTPPRLIAC